MTLLRKLFKREPEPADRLVDTVIKHMWSDLDDVLAHYRTLGIQVDAEFPQEEATGDDHNSGVDLNP